MAYDFDALTTIRPSAAKKARYSKVRAALHSHLGGRTRKRLRKEYKKLNAAFNPTDPVTGAPLRDLERGAREEVRSEYGPAMTQIAADIRSRDQRTSEIEPWFNQWKQHLDTVATQQQQDATNQVIAAQAQQQSIDAKQTDHQKALESRAQGNQFAEQALGASRDAAAGRQQLAANAQAGITERAKMRSDLSTTFGANAQLEGQRQKRISEDSGKTLRQKERDLQLAAGRYFNTRLDAQRQGFIDAKSKEAAAKLAGVKLETDAALRARGLDIQAQNADANTQRANWATDPSNPDNQPKTNKPPSKYTAAKRVEYRDKARVEIDNIGSNVVKKMVTDRKSQYYGRRIKFLQVGQGQGKPFKLVALTPKNREQVKSLIGRNIGEPTLVDAITNQVISGGVTSKQWNAVRGIGINPRGLGLKLLKGPGL